MTDLYADDTTIHCSSRYVSDIDLQLNEDMKLVHEWCTDNDMVINPAKSKLMLIGSWQKMQNVCGI